MCLGWPGLDILCECWRKVLPPVALRPGVGPCGIFPARVGKSFSILIMLAVIMEALSPLCLGDSI